MLVVGAAGAVGSLAVPVAKRMGAHVTAVCSAYAVEHVRALGADAVLDRASVDPYATGGPYDAVLDAAAATSFMETRGVLASGGAFVTTLPNPALVVGKVVGALTGRRCEFGTVTSRRADLEQLGAWLAGGLPVTVAERVPVRELRRAMDALARPRLVGRVVVDVHNGW